MYPVSVLAGDFTLEETFYGFSAPFMLETPLNQHYKNTYECSDGTVLHIQLMVSIMPLIHEIPQLTFKVYCNLALLLLLHLPRLYAARLPQPVTLSSFQGLRPSLIREWKMLNYTSTFILSYAV
jgi:hypothetical protein